MDFCTDALSEIFQVEYTPAGRISSGISCSITVRFTPRNNDDIVAYLPCLAETGKFNVPIECHSRKVIAAISSAAIDFGGLIVGNNGT